MVTYLYAVNRLGAGKLFYLSPPISKRERGYLKVAYLLPHP
jgi:hypothetical protein